MGVLFDDRVVEYAKLEKYDVQPNQVISPVPMSYGHVVSITYVLEDTNNVIIGRKSKTHQAAVASPEDVVTAIATVNSNLQTWVASDMLELSGEVL